MSNCLESEMPFTSKWTAEEIEAVKAGNVPAGRTANAVKLMRQRLGLVKYKVPKWTKEHKAELIRLHFADISTSEIAKILPYTQRSIQKEIVRQKLPHKNQCRFTEIEVLVFEKFLKENWRQKTPTELVILWNQDQGRNGRIVNERKVIVYLKRLGLKIPKDEIMRMTLLKKQEQLWLKDNNLEAIRLRRVNIMRERIEKGRDMWTGMPNGESDALKDKDAA